MSYCIGYDTKDAEIRDEAGKIIGIKLRRSAGGRIAHHPEYDGAPVYIGDVVGYGHSGRMMVTGFRDGGNGFWIVIGKRVRDGLRVHENEGDVKPLRPSQKTELGRVRKQLTPYGVQVSIYDDVIWVGAKHRYRIPVRPGRTWAEDNDIAQAFISALGAAYERGYKAAQRDAVALSQDEAVDEGFVRHDQLREVFRRAFHETNNEYALPALQAILKSLDRAKEGDR